MIASPRSFGFFAHDVFVQGTVMLKRTKQGVEQEIAGLYGDQPFESRKELVKLINDEEKAKAILDKIVFLVNRPCKAEYHDLEVEATK